MLLENYRRKRKPSQSENHKEKDLENQGKLNFGFRVSDFEFPPLRGNGAPYPSRGKSEALKSKPEIWESLQVILITGRDES